VIFFQNVHEISPRRILEESAPGWMGGGRFGITGPDPELSSSRPSRAHFDNLD